MTPKFDVQRWHRDPCEVVRVAGDLDMTAAPRLRAEVDRALEVPGHPCLVMDLTGVPFCDSVGLGVLLEALARIKDTHGRLILVVSPGMITHLLTITNLDSHFETCGSLREALDSAA
ncbi:STAS domain-containing protein [Streptosporangium sp. NPDC000396]|uniref:STAS domain-containing protein n=1 Tax=Streptosporangium sp. NPDC000396 TaxID=3366185 RepID=UPI0036772F6D